MNNYKTKLQVHRNLPKQKKRLNESLFFLVLVHRLFIILYSMKNFASIIVNDFIEDSSFSNDKSIKDIISCNYDEINCDDDDWDDDDEDEWDDEEKWDDETEEDDNWDDEDEWDDDDEIDIKDEE